MRRKETDNFNNETANQSLRRNSGIAVTRWMMLFLLIDDRQKVSTNNGDDAWGRDGFNRC